MTTEFRQPAKKALGQHFLHERGIIEKMLLAIAPKPGDRFVEIGPGQGADLAGTPLQPGNYSITITATSAASSACCR